MLKEILLSRGNDSQGYANITFMLPDTIGSYVFTAISMNRKYGIGFSKVPTQLTVYSPFFVEIRLPREIRRGEILKPKVIVYSFLDQKQ